MEDHSWRRESTLLSDRDTTTPEQDSNGTAHRRKRQRTKRLRKRNTVIPSEGSSPVRPKARGLRLQPIETSGLKGKGTVGFPIEKSHTFGAGEGKMAAVTFQMGSEENEVIQGNITITSSYPSLKEAVAAGNVSDQKSSQKTQSTSLTSMSSNSPRMPGNSRYGPGQRSTKHQAGLGPNITEPPDEVFLDAPFRPKARRGFWWEAYNARLVKPMSTCLLVQEDQVRCLPSPHTQLIDHFIEKYRTVSFSNTKSDAPPHAIQVDLEFMAKCLDSGVDVDQVDGAGQTVLMEAVRSWHLDVIRYLLDNEASVIHQDSFGRTPIHVAAAANRPAVIHLLLDKGANPNSKIRHSGETPLHLASRRGALLSVEALIGRDAYLEPRDYKGRTPFQVAAEFGKGDMVDLLLKAGANPANIDDDGFSSLIHVIVNCPRFVDRAFDSLIQHSDMTEKLLFDPAFLETCPEDWRKRVQTNCLLDVIESQECSQAIRHTVVQTMIKTRWTMFGRIWALMNFFFRFLFFATWTAWILAIRWEVKHNYDWASHWWRGLLPAFGVFFLFWEIKIEFLEMRYSIRRGVTMANIRLEAIQSDLKYIIHPRWKDEETYLLTQEKKTKRLTRWWRQLGLYGRDLWNMYDFIIFGVIVICMITHIGDVVNHNVHRARVHGQLGSVTILLLGIRLMKDTRGFFGPGQLVIMLGLMAADFGRFIFLYIQLYIPFTIAFWIIFGGVRHPFNEVCQVNCSAPVNCTSNCNFTSYVTNECDINIGTCESNRTNVTVAGMDTYTTLCFSLFRLTLVDEYDLDTMISIDPYMSIVLVSAFLLTSAVVGINFLIGLISNVIGDGAREHVQVKSLLQKLRVVLLIEQTSYMLGPRPDKCCHELARKHHELDLIKDFKRDNTFSIRESLLETNKNVSSLRKLMSGVVKQQHELIEQSQTLEDILRNLKGAQQHLSGGPEQGGNLDFEDNDDDFLDQPLSDFRPKSRAMMARSGLELSMSYKHSLRDVDTEDLFRQARRRPLSVKYKSRPRTATKSSVSNRIDVGN